MLVELKDHKNLHCQLLIQLPPLLLPPLHFLLHPYLVAHYHYHHHHLLPPLLLYFPVLHLLGIMVHNLHLLLTLLVVYFSNQQDDPWECY